MYYETFQSPRALPLELFPANDTSLLDHDKCLYRLTEKLIRNANHSGSPDPRNVHQHAFYFLRRDLLAS